MNDRITNVAAIGAVLNVEAEEDIEPIKVLTFTEQLQLELGRAQGRAEAFRECLELYDVYMKDQIDGIGGETNHDKE